MNSGVNKIRSALSNMFTNTKLLNNDLKPVVNAAGNTTTDQHTSLNLAVWHHIVCPNVKPKAIFHSVDTTSLVKINKRPKHVGGHCK
jgi:hypothetical protein